MVEEKTNLLMIKALHHTKIAMEYFEDVANHLSGTQKHTTLLFANKCNWIIDNVRAKLPEEERKKLDEEIRDSLFLDNLETEVLKFNYEQRDVLEKIVSLINKGEQIQIINE